MADSYLVTRRQGPSSAAGGTSTRSTGLQVVPGEELRCNGCHSPLSGLSHGRADSFASVYGGATGNGGAGIMTGDGTTITDCAVSVNGGHGISTGLGCTIRGNTSTTNSGDGIHAYQSLVMGNTSTFNTGANINATDSTVIDNHVGP